MKVYQEIPKSDYLILGVDIAKTRKIFSTLSYQPNPQLTRKKNDVDDAEKIHQKTKN